MTGFPSSITVALMTLAWFAGINAVLSLCAAAVSAGLDERVHGRPSWARWLLAIRLAPAAGSLIAATILFLPAHAWLEPERADERVGLVPLGLALLGLVLLGVSAWRCLATLRAARQLATLTPGPAGLHGDDGVREVPELRGIALAGILRPQILIGSAARELLTPSELDLAVAHERAHQHARDNLSRVLMHCAPDLVRWLPQGVKLERLWDAEAECLADGAAAGDSEVRATSLASALVKVSRLATADPRWAPGRSTFHHPVLLELRVRRLVTGVNRPSQPVNAIRAAALSMLTVIVLAWFAELPQRMHWITEELLVLLP